LEELKIEDPIVFVKLALKQHLGDRRRPAKIPIDLKRRAVVEKVGTRHLSEQVSQDFVGVVAIPGAGPTYWFSTPGPSPFPHLRELPGLFVPLPEAQALRW